MRVKLPYKPKGEMFAVQSDSKCDIVYRYTVTEKERLNKKNFIPEVLK